MAPIASSPSSTPASPPAVRQTFHAGPPPEWPIERVIKRIGTLPGAAGRFLDRLAKIAVIGPIIRFFSSVWLGIIILTLLGVYIAIGSGFASLRAALEMTDLQFFDAWPMRILLIGLALDLIIVTLRRIPMTLFKLGPWIVHIGILTLIGGCVWYFSMKKEGSVRIYLNHSVNVDYDVTERALYAFPVKSDGTFDVAHPTITPLPTLPIFNEHLADKGNPVDITLPPGALAVTGGPSAFSDASVHITGYYPCAILQPQRVRSGRPGETGVGPALSVGLSTDRDVMGDNWLMANSPANRILEGNLPFGIEYLYHPSDQRIKDLQASFAAGENIVGLIVRIPRLNIDRTYSAKLGVPIQVEGSPYTLTPTNIGEVPMLSKGYENAHSSTLDVEVSRKESIPAAAAGTTFDFKRVCVFRYPERSPDFITVDGKPVRKQEGVDPDIQIIFQDTTQTQAWIIEHTNGDLSLIIRTPDGQSITTPLSDKPVSLPVKGIPSLQMRMTEHTQDAVVVMVPAIVPKEQRPRGQSVMEVMQLSMLDVDVSRPAGSGAGDAGWKQTHVYVPFSPYAQIGDPPIGQTPAVIEIPGAGKVGLLLATTRRALPSTITLTKFEPVKYPGAVHSYADYVSTLSVRDHGASDVHTLQPHLNNPAADHGLYYFQAAWDGDDNAPSEKRFSVIGVANRPGILVMVTGAILMILGIGYAFYVKPILLKFKKQSLAAWNEARIQAAKAH